MQITKIMLAGLLLLWAIPALLSCRKENLNGSHAVSDATVIFSATVGGVNWQTDSVSAFMSCAAPDQPRVMTITAFGSRAVITISLRDTAGGPDDSTLSVAQYPVNSQGDAAIFGYAYNRILIGRNMTWQQQGAASHGQATVTASDGINKRISGNFNFAAQVLLIDSTGLRVDTVNVGNGAFKNIPYSYFRHP